MKYVIETRTWEYKLVSGLARGNSCWQTSYILVVRCHRVVRSLSHCQAISHSATFRNVPKNSLLILIHGQIFGRWQGNRNRRADSRLLQDDLTFFLWLRACFTVIMRRTSKRSAWWCRKSRVKFKPGNTRPVNGCAVTGVFRRVSEGKRCDINRTIKCHVCKAVRTQ